jgi:hypothetical protein
MSINSESSILNTSFPGQHKPGNHKKGPNANNAKQALEWLEVGDETSSSNKHTSLWED